MPKRRQMNLQYPLGGLNRHGAHRQTPPYTTRDALNVRPTSTLQGRERGGSRPGLNQSHFDNLGGEVRMLAPMVLALGDGFTSWSDTFNGLSMAAAWTQAAWSDNLPSILPAALASVDTSVGDAAAARSALPIIIGDVTKPYSVEIFLTPWEGAWHGVYTLYFRLDGIVGAEGSPDILTEGVEVTLTMTGTDGAYVAVLNSVIGTVSTELDTDSGTLGSPIPGWLSATVSGDAVTIYWGGTAIMSGSASVSQEGGRVGFGLECTVDGGLALANVFRVQYYSTVLDQGLRSVLIASDDGNLWRESSYSRMTVISSSLTVRDDTILTAAQSGQILVIADYGDLRDTGTDGTMSSAVLDDSGGQDWTTLGIDTDDDVCVVSNVGGSTTAGTYIITNVHATNGITLSPDPGDGTCSYRIERAPKVYDPSDDSIAIITATDGQTPTGCPFTTRYLDRIVLAGAEIAPHVYYMSRVGDYLDWDYAQTDSKRAMAGGTGDAGVPGEPITALAPSSDDYLIFGCRNQLWRMRGDPAYGGSFDALSYTIGIIGPKAWCLGPVGELIFLSMNGLYVLPPGGEKYPIPLSPKVLPREFLNLDPNVTTVSLEFDVQEQGVHIFLTPDSSNTRIHWWFDWENKTFWPLSLATGHEPTATCTMQAVAIEESGVILGGRDGVLRRFTNLAETDNGTSFSTYVTIGPMALGADSREGTVSVIDAVMAENSGDVTWNLYPAQTFEATASASSSDTGTWIAGLNASTRPCCRGQAFLLKITGSSGRQWGVERITAEIHSAGKRRFN